MMGAVRRLGTSLAARFAIVALLMLAAVAWVLSAVGQARLEVPGQLLPGRQSVIITEEARESWWDAARLQARLAQFRSDFDAEVTVRDDRGAVVASNVDPPLAAPREAQLQQLQHAGDRTGGPLPGGRVEIVARVERPGQGPRFVSMELRPLGLRVSRVLTAAVLAVALVGLASLLLAWSVVQPLRRLASTARDFGGGDLAARVRLDRGGELGEVARSFDAMADRVAHMIVSQRETLLDISHELRTPLARIRVALDLLQEQEARPDAEEIGAIQEDLDELDQVLGGILQQARSALAMEGAGPLRLRREAVDLAGIVSKALLRFRLRHPGVDVAVESGMPPLPPIQADPMLLRRALENLLDNAAKHSGTDRPIRVSVGTEGGRIRLAVEDEGRGLEASELARVGTPFFRGGETRSEGLGLGLGLVRRIAEAHGGSLELRSAPGKGTSAILWLQQGDTEPPSA